ncbi:MAG: hypothetical protein J7539_03390 [Niabella sp.]|nr:hypothetical protein [Niabella sp.]
MADQITVGKYTFSSWLRNGIGGNIIETDNLGQGSSSLKERAKVPVDIAVNTRAIHQEFFLIGPGDIIGINPQMIVRTEPLNWITNFEPNYLPFIEFYEEDFLWRYTPAKANGDRHRPWMTLLVLKDTDNAADKEFVFNQNRAPLATVVVSKAETLPLAVQSWAWGHVHINDGFTPEDPLETFLESVHNLNDPGKDKIICRLMSNRKLEANTGYRAFLVPSFETGRLGGLGLDTSTTDAQQPSWQDGQANIEFPVYYHWYFRTSDDADFESLVKILEPRPMDKRIGIRDMDGSKPGFGMTVGTVIGAAVSGDPAPTSIIGLEGALKSPDTISNPQAIDTTQPFFGQLQEILNFPAELQKETNNNADPVVSPPIYGENHAMIHEIDVTQPGWLHGLNKDPRNRVPGGFGVSVIQKNQEDFVARAWQQVKDILAANRKILFGNLSMQVTLAIAKNFISKLSPEKNLLFFSSILKKVKGSPTTLQYQIEQSKIPAAAVSTPLRRMLRPRGAFFKKLQAADPNFSHGTLLQNLNNGTITAAPPKQAPADLFTDDTFINNLNTKTPAGILDFLFKHRLLLLILLLLLALFMGLFLGAWLAAIGLAVVAVGLYFYLANHQPDPGEAEIEAPKDEAKSLQEAPPNPGFTFIETDPVVVPATTGGTTVTASDQATSSAASAAHYEQVAMYTPAAAGADSLEANNFRKAAIALNERLAIVAPEKTFVEFDLQNAFQKLNTATDPRLIFPKLIASHVNFTFNPGWLLNWEHLVPAMAYPDFDDAMYKPLSNISSELLIPNLKLIPPNTISLLVTNPAFIESYMVGLNYEFGKELLWREYPTDERGSYFRQFWDVKGVINQKPGDAANATVEAHRDITPIDTWYSSSLLGQHNKSNPTGAKKVVLVIKGELFKKYPNTIVYAQKAHPNPDTATGPAAVIKEPKTSDDMNAEIQFPLFTADVDPDIKFFGFDLTVNQAKGDDNPKTDKDDWGYYFVIQQVPGEPRFGMEIDNTKQTGQALTWNDLAWTNCTLSHGFINVSNTPTLSGLPSNSNNNTRDGLDQWGQNAALFANIFYRRPYMMAVHAKDMLDKLAVN